MSEPHRSASAESNADSLRKRVCKACDRCRMKKSKCDGEYPCSRCKADNAICQFGERKKTHDKVYPKGYVEMLEQQQGQLISGLQEMYHRSLAGRIWSGPILDESHGHPLTHDVLAALGLLVAKPDGTGETETFEEDCERLQAKLFKAGAAPCMRRKGSFSSESEHSQHEHHMPSAHKPSHTAKQAVFGESFGFSPSPSPAPITPPPRQRQSFPPAQQHAFRQHTTHLPNDPQLYQPQWLLSDLQHPEAILRSKYALQTPRIESGLSDSLPTDEWADPGFVDSPMEMLSPYRATFSDPFGVMSGVSELGASIDPMDLEINKWLQVAT